MLISQRIAKDPSFITTYGATPAELGALRAQLRQWVLNNPKFLVDNYDLDLSDKEGLGTVKEIEAEIFGAANEAKRKKREEIYVEYGHLPYPITLLESDLFLMILMESPTNGRPGWTQVVIDKNGQMCACMISVTYDLDESGRQFHMFEWTSNVIAGFRPYVAEEFAKPNPSHELRLQEESFRQVEATMRLCQWVAAETVLMINTQNVRRILYQPTRRENGNLPPVFHKKMVYHVLDIPRERTVYTSLAEIDSELWKPKGERKTRAHLVKAHYKTIRGVLYRWSSFVRNRKYADELGFVKKDYLVERDDPEPPTLH